MARKLDKLKTRAREQARQHGHDLGRFHSNELTTKSHYANCRRCGSGVVADEEPLEPELSVAGEAVWSKCRP